MPSRIGTRWSWRSLTSNSGTVRVLERLRDRRAREMAGGEMAVAVRPERRLDLGADRLRERAARPETATTRRIHRARDVAVQHDPRAFSAHNRCRNRREERLCIRVQRPREDVGGVRELDDLAE